MSLSYKRFWLAMIGIQLYSLIFLAMISLEGQGFLDYFARTVWSLVIILFCYSVGNVEEVPKQGVKE